jgi:hypothetical protein
MTTTEFVACLRLNAWWNLLAERGIVSAAIAEL